MTLPRLPLTRALVALLLESTGRPCGYGSLPRVRRGDGEMQPADTPYLIVYSLPGSFSGPPLSDWHADAAWTYQATCIGDREDQVQWLADRVRAAMFDRKGSGWATELTVPGMRVVDRELDHDAGGESVESVPGSIVSYVQRFTLTVTPA